jgi:peptide/nickel transport system ATP-binding protein
VAGEPLTSRPAAAPGGILLRVDGLRVELPVGGRSLPAVDGVSFALSEGESVAVVGESGSGKTQLARAILGLSPPGARVSGTVTFGGRELLGQSERRWQAVRGAGIGMVFQEPAAALDPVRTVGAEIVESIRLHARIPRARARALARAALAEVAFPDPDGGLDEYPHRLSGGLRQRAHLASVLAASPRLLLADEPTASLDATVARDILDLLDRLRRDRRLTVLLITHDLGVVARHCDRVLVVYAGRIVEEAPTAALFRAPGHPYTRGLLRSVPRLAAAARRSGERYDAIPGALPDLGERPASGCAFAQRCVERFEPCEIREPGLYPTESGLARCFLHSEGPRAVVPE